MELIPLKSRFLKPNDDLLVALKKALGSRKLKNGDIVVIASKAVASSQCRLVSVKRKKEFLTPRWTHNIKAPIIQDSVVQFLMTGRMIEDTG